MFDLCIGLFLSCLVRKLFLRPFRRRSYRDSTVQQGLVFCSFFYLVMVKLRSGGMILVDKLFITELGTHYNGYIQGFIIGILKLFNKDVTYVGT